MAGLTLDTGALIAAERNELRFWALYKAVTLRGVVPVIPAGVLAQTWRGTRQARLAQLVNACFVEPLDESLARATGLLLAQAGTADAIDASVVATAARRGDAVLTSDPHDLGRLAEAAGGVEVIALPWRCSAP